MKAGEETGIVDLVLKVFTEFVAAEHTLEGVKEFMKYVRNDDLRNRIRAGNLVLLAESGTKYHRGYRGSRKQSRCPSLCRKFLPEKRNRQRTYEKVN